MTGYTAIGGLTGTNGRRHSIGWELSDRDRIWYLGTHLRDSRVNPDRYSFGFVNKINWPHLDATWGILLLGDHSPVAVESFGYDGDWLQVNEIRGIKGNQSYQHPIEWRDLLLQIVVDKAPEVGCRGVRVLSAKHNPW